MAAPSLAYGGLLNFLFESRTGYCQQFATAFASPRPSGRASNSHRGGIPAGDACRARRMASRGGRHPRLAPGALQGIRLDRLRADAGHDQGRVVGSRLAGDDHADHPARGHDDVARYPPSPSRRPPAARRTRRIEAPAVAAAPVCPRTCGSLSPRWRSSAGQEVSGMAPSASAARLREPRAGILAAWTEASKALERAGARRLRSRDLRRAREALESPGCCPRRQRLPSVTWPGSRPRHDMRRRCRTRTALGQAIRDARTVVASAQHKVAPWQKVLTTLGTRGAFRLKGSSGIRRLPASGAFGESGIPGRRGLLPARHNRALGCLRG